jgi:hypothetical protein
MTKILLIEKKKKKPWIGLTTLKPRMAVGPPLGGLGWPIHPRPPSIFLGWLGHIPYEFWLFFFLLLFFLLFLFIFHFFSLNL